jgi:hypothetical protein
MRPMSTMSTINAAETVVRFALGREGYYYEATMWDCGTPWQWARLTVSAWISLRVVTVWEPPETTRAYRAYHKELYDRLAHTVEEQPWL